MDSTCKLDLILKRLHLLGAPKAHVGHGGWLVVLKPNETISEWLVLSKHLQSIFNTSARLLIAGELVGAVGKQLN